MLPNQKQQDKLAACSAKLISFVFGVAVSLGLDIEKATMAEINSVMVSIGHPVELTVMGR